MYLKLILPFLLMVAETLRVTTNRGETEKITYLSLEHATILYVDPDYGKATQFSRQYSRSDPVHYLTVNFTSYFGFGNNYTIHYFFFEFLTNTYKRGFVEMHFGICDMVHKNKYFGISFMQGRLAGPCPYPPGDYSLSNMTVPVMSMPYKTFPFTKARIYTNITFGSSPTDKVICSSYIDMELKQMKKKFSK